MLFGVNKFHLFLYGHKFIIKTDHKPLERLFSERKRVPQQASAKIQRWALTLAAYEYTTSYRVGRNNENADALPLNVTPTSVPQVGETIHLMEHFEGTSVNRQQSRDWTKRDPTLSYLVRFILEGKPADSAMEQYTPYSTKKSELTVWRTVVYSGELVW